VGWKHQAIVNNVVVVTAITVSIQTPTPNKSTENICVFGHFGQIVDDKIEVFQSVTEIGTAALNRVIESYSPCE